MKHGRQIYPDFDARLKNGTSPRVVLPVLLLFTNNNVFLF